MQDIDVPDAVHQHPQDMDLPFPDHVFDEFLGNSENINDIQYSTSVSSVARSSPAERFSPNRQEPVTNHGSLDVLPGAFSFYVGPTGAADIHLLNREAFDAENVTRPRVTGLKYRRLEEARTRNGALYSHPTIFGITDQNLLDNAEPRVETQAIETAWAEMWAVLKPETAWRLIQLYCRFVDPYFPIISTCQMPTSPDELSNMPLALLAVMCATALPFITYDESLYALLLHPPSSQRLYKLCWLDISRQFHSPSLATLQACLLFQQRLPTNPYLSDTAFSWTLISSAVSIAQTIGLHRDPSGWTSVPLWERKVRQRIWWSLWMMEKWICLARGMPSHLHRDDSDVPDLEPEDFANTLSSSSQARPHLTQLVKLTSILAGVQETYYTVRAVRIVSNDLQLSLDLARPFRERLNEWRHNLPSDLQFPSQNQSSRDEGDRNNLSHISYRKDLEGNGSIHLSYIVTHMTLFRALLRPLDRWQEITTESYSRAEILHDGAKAVIKGSLLCVKEFVEFMERLTGDQWNAFWHSWSRPNFAVAGSFMVHLLHITSASTENDDDFSFGEEDRELRIWIERWRRATRASGSGAAGAKGLANLGLLRVETMLSKIIGA